MLDHGDGDTKFGDAGHEFASAIQRIDYPDCWPIQARGVVHAFFRQPSFAVNEGVSTENGIHRPVGFGHGIVTGFVFGGDGARGETVKNCLSCQRGILDSPQGLCIEESVHNFAREIPELGGSSEVQFLNAY